MRTDQFTTKPEAFDASGVSQMRHFGWFTCKACKASRLYGALHTFTSDEHRCPLLRVAGCLLHGVPSATQGQSGVFHCSGGCCLRHQNARCWQAAAGCLRPRVHAARSTAPGESPAAAECPTAGARERRLRPQNVGCMWHRRPAAWQLGTQVACHSAQAACPLSLMLSRGGLACSASAPLVFAEEHLPRTRRPPGWAAPPAAATGRRSTPR
eukprot:358421-Chlamydomonas_euryale.AAC.7